MNLNTCSGAGAGAIDLKTVSSGAGAWSILGQLPSRATETRKDKQPYLELRCVSKKLTNSNDHMVSRNDNQQPPQRGDAVPDPVWVGSK